MNIQFEDHPTDPDKWILRKPKRESTWVGLTEQDRMEISDKLGLMDVAWLDLMEAIETKLREKNT